MEFYCKYDNPDHPWQTGGNYSYTPGNVQTKGQAVRDARRQGWLYHRDGTATCPFCAKALVDSGK